MHSLYDYMHCRLRHCNGSLKLLLRTRVRRIWESILADGLSPVRVRREADAPLQNDALVFGRRILS